MGDSVQQILVKKNDVVAASETKVVDTIGLPEFDHVEYSVSYVEISGPRSTSFKISVSIDDNDIKEQVFARVPNDINILIDTQIDSGNFQLQIQNQDTSSFEVRLARLKL